MLGAKLHARPALAARSQRLGLLQCWAGKGFGKREAAPPPVKKHHKGHKSGPKKNSRSPVDAIKEADRQADLRIQALELLKEFRRADDKTSFAFANRHRLTPEFFVITDNLLKMAQSRGHIQEELELQGTFEAACDVKGSQLRPEIQLVNRLMMSNVSPEARCEILASEDSLATLRRDDSYILLLLDTMIADAEQNRAHNVEDREAVIGQLRSIKADCLARLAEGEAAEAAGQQPLPPAGQEEPAASSAAA